MTQTWDSEVHWDACELVARNLASFRLGLDAKDPHAYNENEKLMAGIIIGSLWANGFLTPRIDGSTNGELVQGGKE